MTLSAETIRSLEAADGEHVSSSIYVTSGAANDVFRIYTAPDQSFVVKVSQSNLPDIFLHESNALNHIASTHTVRTPRVISACDSYLVLEDLALRQEESTISDWESFGKQVGLMHSVHSDYFGYVTDNYIGQWPQSNTPTSRWIDFYWENRVACYLEAGKNKHILTKTDRDGIKLLVDSLGDSVPDQSPSLCHGDLWYENVFRCLGGDIYLIDPAVHYGLAEADLVMTEIYGGFPDAFFDGYRDVHELLPDWKDRVPLYQLKELLLMTAQFGDEKSLLKLRSSIKQVQL